MRCYTAQQLLLLHREGERTARQERRLARHLRTCAACRESSAQSTSEYDELLHTLRVLPPAATSENELVHTVLARIQQQQKHGERERRRYDTVPSMLLPYAAAMLLVLITSGFMLQFITVHNRAEALGRMLTEAASPAVRVDIGYEIRPTTAQLASLDSLGLLSAPAQSFAQRRRISRPDAESLLRIAALDARYRRQLAAAIEQHELSATTITPLLTLRIQYQGA